MHGAVPRLAAGAALLAFAVLSGWLGARLGRRAARKYPGLAMGLILFSSFFRLDPPPPPRAERIIKDEEDEVAAGDPSKPRST